MNNKTTLYLAVACVVIIGIGGIIGITTASKPTLKPTPIATKPVAQPKLSDEQLTGILTNEQAAITSVLLTTYPNIENIYTINDGRLYDQGQWYATTLTYKGTDSDNRDTLRVIMLKKDGIWAIAAKPQLLISVIDYPTIPKTVIDAVNKPAFLPGTDTSPAITPS